jgi:glutamine amidotransferase
MVHPIIDEYYNHNPYHSRSSQYVQDKGLVTSEKGANGASPSGGTTGLANGRKSALSTALHENIASTLLSSMQNRSASPALSPANEIVPRYIAPLADIRHLTTLPTPQEPNTVEQGNTKKKRLSISAENQLNPQEQPQPQQQVENPASPSRTFGAANKIAQYFPELG